MLYDENNKILFTGDTFYLGAFYAHFDCDEFGKSNVEDYYRTMNCLLERCSDIKALYCSHNDFSADPIKITETALAFKSILCSCSDTEKETHAGHTYLEDGTKLKEYGFNGFSIITKEYIVNFISKGEIR